MRRFIIFPVRAAAGAGLAATAVLLFAACDAGGANTVQACRDGVPTMDVARATYRLNQARAQKLDAADGGAAHAVARAEENLRLAQAALAANRGRCGVP